MNFKNSQSKPEFIKWTNKKTKFITSFISNNSKYTLNIIVAIATDGIFPIRL